MDPVLVTGSSGLVGRRVAERLHADGVDVLGVDLAPGEGAFPSVVGDAADLGRMRALIRGRPNVVHAGAVSGPMLLPDDPHAIARANLGGAMSVFEACYRAEVRRLVWLSSVAVYGAQPTLDPVPETTPANPGSFYGHTKAAGEHLLLAYVAQYGLRAVALRLSTVYGERRQTACGLRAAIEAGLDGRPVTVPAEGSVFRQYIHVDDAAEAVLLALAAPAPRQLVYNVTGGTWLSEATAASMLQAVVPGLMVEHGPPNRDDGHLGPLLLEAAERDFFYRPRVALRDGMAELAAAIRRQRGA